MEEVIKVEDCGENIGDYDIPIHNAIIIPRGATNGDMIKAMFPNCEQKENIHNGYFEMYFDDDFGNPSYMTVSKNWWNAPFKRGREE